MVTVLNIICTLFGLRPDGEWEEIPPPKAPNPFYITLTEDDFRTLISGGHITWGDNPQFDVILVDIGWSRMRGLVDIAQLEAAGGSDDVPQ